MASPQKHSPLDVLISLVVVAIILTAFAMSGAAAIENLRFLRAADQILQLVSNVRTVAAGQKNFARNPGEDVWDDLARAGRGAAGADHRNPWGGDVSAVTVDNGGIRVETDLPVRNCRRLLLYFIGRVATETGLVGAEAQPAAASAWVQVYPVAATRHGGDRVEMACGIGDRARLALVFNVR